VEESFWAFGFFRRCRFHQWKAAAEISFRRQYSAWVKPLLDHCEICFCQYAALLVFFFVFAIVHLRQQLCRNQCEKKDVLGRTITEETQKDFSKAQ
jgi:hypothetical protein